MSGLAEIVRDAENVFARAFESIPEADLLAYLETLGISEQKRARLLREYHAQRAAVARPLPLITPPPASRRTRAQRLNVGSLVAYLNNMRQVLRVRNYSQATLIRSPRRFRKPQRHLFRILRGKEFEAMSLEA